MSQAKEVHEYFGFTGKQRRDTALHSLEGLLAGVELDGDINVREVREVRNWAYANSRLADRDAVVRELIRVVTAAASDDRLTSEEIQDIRALCSRAKSDSPYYDAVTHAIQELHGLLHGCLADSRISREEVAGLEDWIERHSYLRQFWPVAEIESVLVRVMADGVIDEAEQRMMSRFFSEFVPSDKVRSDLPPVLPTDLTIRGVCAVDPEIQFCGKVFCFTGVSSKGPRAIFADVVTSRGGIFIDSIRSDLDYLVIGDDGNPCWAFCAMGER